MNTAIIQNELKKIKYPGFSRDIVSFGIIKNIDIQESNIEIDVQVTTTDQDIPKKIQADIENALRNNLSIQRVTVKMNVLSPKKAQPKSATKPPTLQKVRHIIAIASGKGGVGKSTITTNLACAFSTLLRGQNKKVGVMDCDIYGPSIPLMLGIHNQPEIENENLLPPEGFGIKMMSMGLLIDQDSPVVWRGPMVTKAISQFANNVEWGELEVLLVDLSPGTGDAQLSISQTFPLDGAIIVTTPQQAASNVALRGAMMFPKVNIPILGVIENMSYLVEPDGSKNLIFGEGGGQRTAEILHTELLGSIPLDKSIREGSDQGIPIVLSHPESLSTRLLLEIASGILSKIYNAKLNND